MGANAVTSIPDFVALQVLTAAELDVVNCGVPVFVDSTARDAAFGGSGEKTLAEGQFAYLESDKKTYVYDGSSWVLVGASKMTKIETFTTSGTWTVPAGVTYAIAHIRGGGGGVGWNSAPGTGGSSSVAFAGGTVTAAGGVPFSGAYVGSLGSLKAAIAGTANSGNGASVYIGAQDNGGTSTTTALGTCEGQGGAEIVAGGDVTPAASITITVGAGGAAGANTGAAGGSGLVWIEYQE